MCLLRVDEVSKKQKESLSVRNVSFTQQTLQKMAIAGETGSGKTTLLKMIAGLIQPDQGRILFHSEIVQGPNEQLIPGRKEIAYLSQNFELRNNYWVHEILDYANELTKEEAKKLYEVCQIDHLALRRTDELSGGEKQRIALARLLSTAPQLLLLDEPFSNLDLGHKNIMKRVIHDIGTRLNISCILVSHDAQDLLSWADRILVMKDGEIIQEGSPEELYRKPINIYCAELFGDYNLIDASISSAFTKIPGIIGKGMKLIVRPAHIQIVTPGDNAIRGMVQKVLFQGNFYILGVLVGQQMVYVQTAHHYYRPGDEVSLWFTVNDGSIVDQ